ncbi:MAG: hypothetical protein ACRC1F_00520 [Metamycoplasmataceae bacterium]
MKKIFLSYCTADEEFVDSVFENIKSKNPKLNIFKFNKQKYSMSFSKELIMGMELDILG